MKKSTILVFAALLTISCTDLSELNVNPTKSSSIDPSLLITKAQLYQSQGYWECRNFLVYPGGVCNNWAGAWDVTTYGSYGTLNALYSERMWMYYYPQIITPINLAKEQTKDDPALVNIHAAAKLIRAECFLRMTDYYGDIPYFHGGTIYFDGLVDPPYDRQEDIYKDLLKECAEAVSLFNPEAKKLSYDLYYNGDPVKWKRFGASLWLRIAMRLVRVEPELARSEAEKAIAAGLMESNEDICFLKHEDSRVEQGPGNGFSNYMVSELQEGTSVYQESQEMIDAMEDDPRITIFGRNYLPDGTDVTESLYAVTHQYVGRPAQTYFWEDLLPVVQDNKGRDCSRYARILTAANWITKADAPFIHLSYAETEFLRAEAALNGWTLEGSVEDHYKKGLIAAIKQWSLFDVPSELIPSDSQLNSYAATCAARYLTGKTRKQNLEEINKQLWILHTLDPVEGWSNIRRTEMPSLYVMFKNTDPTVNETGGVRYNRMPYPIEEQKKNPKCYREAIERLGGKDDWTKPMWWQGGTYE